MWYCHLSFISLSSFIHISSLAAYLFFTGVPNWLASCLHHLLIPLIHLCKFSARLNSDILSSKTLIPSYSGKFLSGHLDFFLLPREPAWMIVKGIYSKLLFLDIAKKDQNYQLKDCSFVIVMSCTQGLISID